jgi:hypothetical protein
MKQSRTSFANRRKFLAQDRLRRLAPRPERLSRSRPAVPDRSLRRTRATSTTTARCRDTCRRFQLAGLHNVGPPLTVGNELNKLASNISIGRNASGVRWRSDGVEGMNLGEAAAIAVLQDLRNCYNENFDGFAFTKFDGTPIAI